MEIINSVGRRKESIARVFLKKGSGNITVNSKDYKKYFGTERFQNVVHEPFKVLESMDKYDVKVNVEGGGVKGQAEAIRLGIARALCKENPEVRIAFKKLKLLTRDPRSVERKKFGFRKARRGTQFSKR